MLLQGVPHEVGRVHAVRGRAARLLGERERSAERRHQLGAERSEAELERMRRLNVVESAVRKARDRREPEACERLAQRRRERAAAHLMKRFSRALCGRGERFSKAFFLLPDINVFCSSHEPSLLAVTEVKADANSGFFTAQKRIFALSQINCSLRQGEN